ncbi:3-hydroxyacyl-CoA dehydrogenase family protein [Clostridium thailandense]|nr:3-hydroxyacyl-CoA dehydrogenase NAD-binding domain-containing protein [Clostridium thailandense]
MIKNISILGAGTMGHGIANVFAIHGYKVSLYESFEAIRNSVIDKIKSELEFMVAEDYIDASKIEETLSNITLYDDLAEAVKCADYVIEATPENLELKQNLFKQLDELCPKNTIFASNTSSLPLSDMMALLPEDRKARTMICHWYNPAYLIPIAELSFFGNMSEEVFDEVYELYIKSEKQPVKVLKDIPGLIANRMLHALAREVFTLIEQGAASPEDIDKALKFGPGFRSATTGMLEVADMGGLDIWCTVEDNLFKELNKSDKACDMLRQKVSEGKLGLKSGEGFFTYSDDVKAKLQSDFNKRLISQLKVSKNY